MDREEISFARVSDQQVVGFFYRIDRKRGIQISKAENERGERGLICKRFS